MEATLVQSRTAPLAGRALSGLAIAFLLFDATIKLVNEPHAVEGTARFGVPEHLLSPIGGLELACLVLYVVPRTAFVGALLLTGFLGGAVAMHVRIEDALLTHTLFPVYTASVVWAGLALRDGRVLALFNR